MSIADEIAKESNTNEGLFTKGEMWGSGPHYSLITRGPFYTRGVAAFVVTVVFAIVFALISRGEVPGVFKVIFAVVVVFSVIGLILLIPRMLSRG